MMKSLNLDDIPTPIQTSSRADRIPLFLIHDGSGLINHYQRLPSLERAVYALPNPSFLQGPGFSSVIDMASHYADLIRKIHIGPVILGGEYSHIHSLSTLKDVKSLIIHYVSTRMSSLRQLPYIIPSPASHRFLPIIHLHPSFVKRVV
jgi:hypothetical protein